MISIEAHRAAIGRFYGKTKIKDKRSVIDKKSLTFFIFIVIFLLIMFYGLLVKILYTFHITLPYLMLLVIYSISLASICMLSDSLFMILQKKVCSKNVLMRKSMEDKSLVQFRKCRHSCS